MDVTFTIPQIGEGTVLLNYNIPLESPYFLISLTDPCGVDTKYAIFDPSGCNYNWAITFTGVQAIYEDLTSGDVYWDEAGTWSGSIYYQASSSNQDPDNATLVDYILVQVMNLD